MTDEERGLVREALELLGVRRLFLGVFSSSFPVTPHQDLGRGSGYSEGGRRFLDFAARLGFTGVQLGPLGLTSASNPSPYDGAMFSQDPLDIAPGDLFEAGLLDRRVLEELISATPAPSALRVDHLHAWRSQARVLEEAWKTHRRAPGDRQSALDDFASRNRSWLVPDGLYELLSELHGGRWHGAWGEGDQDRLDRALFDPAPGQEARCVARREDLLRRHPEALARYAFGQWILAEQHQGLRRFTRGLGLELYGDLQIGVSPRDEWANAPVFLREYRLGAPPSRTNPEGQAWNYAVLAPEGRGPSLLRARAEKLFMEFDGLRVDHPHGLVDPWVYRAGAEDPLAAVQAGARLRSSPSLTDHPLLARYAICRPEQLSPDAARYADDLVRSLEPEQVASYGSLFDVLVEAARASGRGPQGLVCEVLSTLPFPLRQVLRRHGLGRFRVAQKANLDDPSDVYRCENARPEDWVMLGNHDTPTLWTVLSRWGAAGTLPYQVAYLARRLAPAGEAREQLALAFTRDPGLLAQGHLANLFVSPAENVQVFFTDLMGMLEPFNRPGTTNPANWSLRVPPDYSTAYPQARARNAALHLPRALSLALRGRGLEGVQGPLVRALERLP